MPWTNPGTYAVGAVLTAAKLNAEVVANLRYLKGLDEPVVISNTLTATALAGALTAGGFALTGTAPGGTVRSYADVTNGVQWNIRGDAGKNTWLAFSEDDVADRWITGCTAGSTAFQWQSGGVGSATERMRLTAAGRLGIGVNVPQGVFHARDSAGGGLLWSTGISGDITSGVVPILPNGTVAQFAAFFGMARVNNGTIGGPPSGAIYLAPGQTGVFANLNSSADRLDIIVQPGGMVQINRAAGSGTWKAAIWVLYI